MRDLIAKARKTIEEKRQIDHPEADITSQRIASRLALNQMVADVNCYDHLDYHSELEQLGCKFIHDQVECLKMFRLRFRSEYLDESSSILEKYEISWCYEYSTRKK